MKIRIRTNLGSVEYPGMPWQCGEEREVDNNLGASLIARGVAEEVAQPKQALPSVVSGVPDSPAIAEPARPAIAGVQSKPIAPGGRKN